tara:strand:- start:265 stop:474 length:210 start_codon:yes stop_codon:yes gene_type:complete
VPGGGVFGGVGVGLGLVALGATTFLVSGIGELTIFGEATGVVTAFDSIGVAGRRTGATLAVALAAAESA